MRFAVLFFLAAISTGAQMIPFPGPGSRVVANTVWNTPVQSSAFQSCTGTGSGTQSCSITVTSTTAGNLLVLASSAFQNLNRPSFVSCTGDTLVHPSGVYSHNNYSAGAVIAGDFCYILSATGGTTSFTFSWNVGGSSALWAISVQLLEYHRSTGTAIYDTGNINNDLSGACTSCSAVGLTLGAGATDVVVELFVSGSAAPTAVSGSFASPSLVTDSSGNDETGLAGAINQVGTLTAPTFTQATSSKFCASAVAFK